MSEEELSNDSQHERNSKQQNIKYVRNKINCQIWSNSDFQKLQEGVKQYGKNWLKIRDVYFKDRQPNCLKCKYNYYLRKQKQLIAATSDSIAPQEIKKRSSSSKKQSTQQDIFPRMLNNRSPVQKYLNNSINSVFSDLREPYVNQQKYNPFADLFSKGLDELSHQLINNQRQVSEMSYKPAEQQYQITKNMPTTQSVDMMPFTIVNDSLSVGAQSVQSWGVDFDNLGFSDNND